MKLTKTGKITHPHDLGHDVKIWRDAALNDLNIGVV